MQPHPTTGVKHRSPLLFIFITVFVDLLGYGMIVPLLPFYVEQQNAGAIAVGLLGSLYALMQFIAAPIIGGLSDRHGRRPVLLVCLFGTACAYVLLGLSQTLWLLVLAVALDGITGGSMTTAQAYIADSTSPAQRARGLGLIGAAFGLGMLLGPVFGGLLSLHSLSTPAFVAAAIAFSNVVFGVRVLPESLPPARRATSVTVLNPLAQLLAVVGMPRIRTLLLAIVVLNLSFSGLLSNFPLFSAARFGWDATSNAFFFAFVGVCAILTQGVLIGHLQSRLGETRLALAGLALMALNLGLLALIPQAWMLYPVVGLLALGSGLSIPALTSLVSQRVSEREQGKLFGGSQSLLSLAMIIGPVLAGIAFDLIGVSAPYWIGSLLATTAFVLAGLVLVPEWNAFAAAHYDRTRARVPEPD